MGLGFLGGIMRYEEDEPNEEVQCWHTEPGTPCDWNQCNQPERLERGDVGVDPAEMRFPFIDKLRGINQ